MVDRRPADVVDHRARDAAGATREVDRRGAVAERRPEEDRWRTNRLAADSISRGRRAASRVATLRAGTSATGARRCGRVWSSPPCCSAVDGGDRSAPASICRCSSTPTWWRAPPAAARTRSSAPAKRGDIVDRNGHLLAYSVDADSIIAVPSEIEDADAVAASVCGALDDCTPPSGGRWRRRLRRRRSSPTCARRCRRTRRGACAALELEGIGFVKESRRYYPKRELLAHVLGYVGLDNAGLGGSKSTYDAQIRGKRRHGCSFRRDAKRRAFSRVERAPTAGASLELTIDEYLQHIAERELQRRRRSEPAPPAAPIVVMDPATGEILALANCADVQPERLPRSPRRAAPQPRDPGPLRAGLDVQGRHRVRGARRRSDHARRSDRRQRRA